jgi:predicted nucleic acid-binding protein
MGSGYLIDTNVVIDYFSEKLPLPALDFIDNVVNSSSQISIMTKIELLCFTSSARELEFLTKFIQDSVIYELDEAVVARTISIRKARKLKIPDAIIAATAIVHNCQLITRNVKDFNSIDSLKILDPWALA